MATSPDLQEPQIAAARAQAWHQTGDPVLTLEAARTWLEAFGLVLFAPIGATLGAPAPSLVAATLGEDKSHPTLGEAATARSLVARLVGEGNALPLNLLGGPGDVPDFVVTAQAFPFVFTLRGDKGWKRPPETAGTVKVTPLALRVYELLAEKGALPIADIVPEIGREVTESAISRALNELWQILRVIPVLQQGEGETVWELTTSRFLKAVKAGANAGQPTALSGLVSLYLSQVLVATEEEIAGFLSPLTARSRVRDVLHGLVAGRQLEEGVVAGKTVLYVPEQLPDLAQFAAAPEGEAVGDAGAEQDAAGDTGAAPEERIRRFDEGQSAKDRGLRGKPVRREGAGGPLRRAPSAERGPRREGRSSFPSTRGPRQDRFGAGGEGERSAPRREGDGERPFRHRDSEDRPAPRGPRQDRPSGDRPAYTRPWDEERPSRPPRRFEGGDRPSRPREDRRPPQGGEGGEERPNFRRREFTPGGPPRRDNRAGGAGNREGRFGGAGRSDRPARPFRPRGEGDERPFAPRREGGDRPFRPRPEGSGEDRPYSPRRTEGGDRPFRPRRDEEGRGGRPFGARPSGPGGPRSGGFRKGSGFGAGRPAEGGPARGKSGGAAFRRPGGERPDRGAGAEGGERRPPRRPFSPGGSGEEAAARGGRPQGRSFGGGKRPGQGGSGGFRPGGGRRGGPGETGGARGGPRFGGRSGGGGRPAGPKRPGGARPPRSEDEA